MGWNTTMTANRVRSQGQPDPVRPAASGRRAEFRGKLPRGSRHGHLCVGLPTTTSPRSLTLTITLVDSPAVTPVESFT